MSEWQPIETAPKDGTDVLLFGQAAGEVTGFIGDGHQTGIGYWRDGTSDYGGDNWWQITPVDAYAVWIEPTHWMPLPPPPTYTPPQ